jgi:hypothetical protein
VTREIALTTQVVPDKPATLAAALAAFQSSLPKIAKDAIVNAGAIRYKYADLAGVSAVVLPLLGSVGLSFNARPTVNEQGQFVLAYELLHTSNESRTGQYPLPDVRDPKQIGSAITYARRYALCSVVGVAPDEDDDGTKAADGVRQQREPAPLVNQQQHRKMQGLWRDLGYGGESNRDKRLHITARILGMEELATSAALSGPQAERVIEALEQKKREQEEAAP